MWNWELSTLDNILIGIKEIFRLVADKIRQKYSQHRTRTTNVVTVLRTRTKSHVWYTRLVSKYAHKWDCPRTLVEVVDCSRGWGGRAEQNEVNNFVLPLLETGYLIIHYLEKTTLEIIATKLSINFYPNACNTLHRAQAAFFNVVLKYLSLNEKHALSNTPTTPLRRRLKLQSMVHCATRYHADY